MILSTANLFEYSDCRQHSLIKNLILGGYKLMLFMKIWSNSVLFIIYKLCKVFTSQCFTEKYLISIPSIEWIFTILN